MEMWSTGYRNGDMFIFLSIIVIQGIVNFALSANVDDGVNVKFSTTLDQSAYITIYRVTLSGCVRYCDVRVKCRSVTYRRRTATCELHDADGDQVTTRRVPGAVLVEKKSWKTKSGVCGTKTCTGNQNCNEPLSECTIKECKRLFGSARHRFLGNMQNTGARTVKECNTGLVFPDGSNRRTLTCQPSGVWDGLDQECEPVTCLNAGGNSGNTADPVEYESFDLTSERVIKIMCVFDTDHGYTYISKEHLAYVADLSRYYTTTDHVMIRHKRSDDSQWEGKFSVLSKYSDSYNVTVLANKNTDFYESGAGSGNYILVGLVPNSFGSKYNTTQGYTFEGFDVIYLNCDENRNNQFVLAVDKPIAYQQDPHPCLRISYDATCAWISRTRPATHLLPDNYFYWYAMLMGGCGTAANHVSVDGVRVTGASVGLRFDL